MSTLHVSLPDEVMERLRLRSARSDVPVARLVRRAVLEFLGEDREVRSGPVMRPEPRDVVPRFK